ncbi:MAG: TolC family outer membrane protein [Caulobacteraceae bacterium]
MARLFRTSLAITAGASAIFCASASLAESLADAIALAYQTNPTLQAARANLRFVEEGVVQARAGYRPSVTAQATADYSHANRTNTFGQVQNRPQTLNSGTAIVQVTQPLYTGGRVSAAVSAAQADALSQTEDLRQSEADILQQTITAYVDVRRDQQAILIRMDNVAVLRRQVEETRTRFDVGEVTRTDVAQAEAQLAQAQALLSNAQAQLAISRASYAQVVGQSPGELEPEPVLKLPPTIDDAFDAALQYNPTIRSADYSRQGAVARLAQAKAERNPRVSVVGSYGYSGSPLLPTPNSDNFIQTSRASLQVTQPIFAGGAIESGVRQAVERENFFISQGEGARRDAIRNLSQAWNRLLAARASILANQEQVRAARVAFEGAQAEQAVGLRTTLEVLTAQQVLRDAELALLNARHDEYVASATVLNVTGMLAAQNIVADLPPGYGPHDPHQLKTAPGYVPWEEAVRALDSIKTPDIKRLPAPPSEPVVSAVQPVHPGA